jgi:hydrophobic/amphiphilic exporter-1 (mainly G- bacteria), HAE1 family
MIRLSIRRPVAIAMTYFAIALLGVAAWRNLPVELLPNTEFPRLSVGATWRGASPEATEAFLTSPMEAAIQQVRGVERVQSTSTEGTTRIEIEFQRDTDLNFARLELSERLNALDDVLPSAASRPVIEPYVPQEFQEQSRPFLRFTVTGPYTTEALRAHTDQVIAPELEKVEGVARIDVRGGRQRLIEIELDEHRIGSLGLTLGAVRTRIQMLEDIREAGVVEVDGMRHSLAIRQRARSLDDLRQLPVLSDRGRTVRLGEVATVRDAYEEATSHYRIDGRPALTFTVQREYGTNVIDVAERVRARVAELEPVYLPGVSLILDGDESEAIRAQFSDMRNRALFSVVVIFLVLLLFLRSGRSAAIVFATIGFSALITLNGVYWGGLSLNILTLMGIAMGFGLIVDNAIVVLENIYRHRRSGMPAPEAAERGAREMVLPVLAATLTTLIVVVPFVYLQGELRLYYVPLALVVGIAVLASVFVAFSFIPALAARILRRGFPTRSGGMDEGNAATAARPFYTRIYEGLTRVTLRFPWITVVVAATVLYGSWRLFDEHVNRGTLWRSWAGEPTFIRISITLPRGEEVARVDEMARFFEERIPPLPGVGRYVTNVNAQSATLRVEFPDSIRYTTLPLIAEELLKGYAVQLGGAQISVRGFGQAFAAGGMGGAAPNYTIRILGFNYETVREIAEGMARRLSAFSRIEEVDPNSGGFGFTRDRATELVVEPDRARLALHGLTSRDLTEQVSAAVAGSQGIRGPTLRIGGEQLGYVVKLEGHSQMDVRALENLMMTVRSGENVRLGDVASIRERQVLSRITRVDQQYERSIAYEFRGPARLGDLYRDAVIESTALPPGYTILARRDFLLTAEDRRQIYNVLLIGLVLVFMLTAALFESLRQPFVVLLTVPMALVGVFLLFFYANASFTREAYIGVIMMAGIVVNNSILLVDHINRLRRETTLALERAILRGTLDRTRPILMTSATTIFGLLPLVLFSETADANIWNALGYALIGGLASSTVFVLTVTPALYLLLERPFDRGGWRRAARSVGAVAGWGGRAASTLRRLPGRIRRRSASVHAGG